MKLTDVELAETIATENERIADRDAEFLRKREGEFEMVQRMEAATKLKAIQDKLKAAETAVITANTQETALYAENGRLRVLLRKVSNYHLSSWSTENRQADALLKLLNDIDAEIGPPK